MEFYDYWLVSEWVEWLRLWDIWGIPKWCKMRAFCESGVLHAPINTTRTSAFRKIMSLLSSSFSFMLTCVQSTISKWKKYNLKTCDHENFVKSKKKRNKTNNYVTVSFFPLLCVVLRINILVIDKTASIVENWMNWLAHVSSCFHRQKIAWIACWAGKLNDIFLFNIAWHTKLTHLLRFTYKTKKKVSTTLTCHHTWINARSMNW